MKRDIRLLGRGKFDLIVIGGGIIGAGIARDAALRGLHTLVLEKEDFSFGTTSRSSRLIHGGLRYLRMLDFKLVRQDLREREILLHIAPHLVHRLPFIIPVPRGSMLFRLGMPVGMRLYNLLSSGKSLPSWQSLSAAETRKAEPSLSETKRLIGSYLYYDCQAEFMERLCLENILSAAEHDACVLNHAEVTGFIMKNNSVAGVRVQDNLTGEQYSVNSRMVVNAGGPWSDIVWSNLNRPKTMKMRKTKGIHLLTRRLSEHALVLIARKDGRLFFVIPWEGYSLIGTTDTDYVGDLDTVCAERRDVDYLVEELQHTFPGFTRDDIHYTVAGIRPLVAAEGKAESNTSRAHKLIDHERKDGVKNFISVSGGKITAYRGIAEEAVDMVFKKRGIISPCVTAQRPLPGAPAVPAEDIQKAANEVGLDGETVSHLARLYGSRFTEVTELVREDASLGQLLTPGSKDIQAQVKHAVDNEMALTVADFLLRRCAAGWQADQGLAAAETVAKQMGEYLGWSKEETAEQLDAYKATAALGQHYREA